MNKKMAAAWLICFALLLLMPGAVWAVTKGSFPDGCDGKYGFNRDSEADEGQLQRLSGTGGERV